MAPTDEMALTVEVCQLSEILGGLLDCADVSTLLSAVVALLGIVVGAVIVVWQMGKQHRSTLELQEKNHKQELKLEIYEELRVRIEVASGHLSKAIAYSVGIPGNIELYWKTVHNETWVPTPISERASEIARLHYTAIQEVICMTEVLEGYRIAIPRASIFLRMFAIQERKSSEAFTKYHSKLLLALPVDVPDSEDGQCVVLPEPGRDEMESLVALGEEYLRAEMMLAAFIQDLSVALQNSLLGELFDEKIPLKVPSDSDEVVIRIDDEGVAKLQPILDEEDERERL